MWRPRLPKKKDGAFWGIAAAWVGLPALAGAVQGASIMTILLVSAASFGLLYVMTERS